MLEERIASLERELLAVYASTSWRITKPLRFLSRHLKSSSFYSVFRVVKQCFFQIVQLVTMWFCTTEKNTQPNKLISEDQSEEKTSILEKQIKKEQAEIQCILASGRFQAYHENGPIESMIRHYVRGWASGDEQRKPIPGFHPWVYIERHGLALENADPFADYLRAGQPKGPWEYPVIMGQKGKKQHLPENSRVALHMHVYYPELFPEIIQRLELNRVRPDLFISVRDEISHQLISEAIAGYDGKVVDIKIVPNRGRDIGPLLTTFGQELVENYEFIGHLHTKKSLDYKDSTIGQVWFSFLLKNLLGGSAGGKMADTILAEMINDPSIGIVFPEESCNVCWGSNRSIAETIAPRLGISHLFDNIIFPAGTMFWVRSSLLEPFVKLGFGWEDYPAEPLAIDGTLLHTLERLFGLIGCSKGQRCAVTYVPGVPSVRR